VIREYRESDLDTLLDLFRASVHRLAAGDYCAEQLEAWAPVRPDRRAWTERLSSGRTLVSERGGRIAGFARAEADGCIDLLYVHPDCVRRGVGGELLEHVIEWLRAQGAERAWTHASDTARPAFERAGFRVLERRVVERGGIEIRNWLMALELDD